MIRSLADLSMNGGTLEGTMESCGNSGMLLPRNYYSMLDPRATPEREPGRRGYWVKKVTMF